MDKRSIIFVLLLTAVFLFINHWFGSKDKERAAAQKPKTEAVKELPQEIEPSLAPSANVQEGETFYVLENAYQQLVFSSRGGAIAEINLPLQSASHPKSPVRTIDIDRWIEKKQPQNDYFPLFPYFSAPKTYHEQGSLGGYYPLLRRPLLKGRKKQNGEEFYAFALVNTQGERDSFPYTVKKFEKDLIELVSEQPKRRIIKTFRLPKDPDNAPFCFECIVHIEGDARGLALASGVPEVELISDNFTPAIKYRWIRQHKPIVEQIDLPKTSSSFSSVKPDWVSNSNGFLGLIIDPLKEGGNGFTAQMVPGESDPTRLTLVDAAYNLYPANKYPGYEVALFLNPAAQTTHFRVYAGPYQESILAQVDATYSDFAKNYTSALSFHGWFTFISEPFAKFLFFLMNFFYQVTRSWGASIILLTVALRIMLYPLNAWSIKSTLKMQEIAPLVSMIQEKHKKDPKRAQMEVMNLYREKGVNPLTGCLPLLIQIPFLMGMFDLLKSTFELRGASFIPGWIDNLSSPDVVFSWGYPILFFGTQFHLLPLILAGVMYWQQKISSPFTGKDPKLLTDQQKQQKMMGNIMVIVFAVMFYHFPSGLNLYWLFSMLLGILQQWYMQRGLQHASVGKLSK